MTRRRTQWACLATAALLPLEPAWAAGEGESQEEGKEGRVISRTVTRRRVRGRTRPMKAPEQSAPKRESAKIASPAVIADETSVEERAERERAGSGWSAVLEGGTDAPLFLGGGLLVEAPARVRVRLGLGVLSDAYMSAGNSILRSYYGDEYPEETADLVRDVLSGSLVVRAHVGVRPWAGWYVHGGYSLATLGADLTGAQVSRAAGLDESYEGSAPIPSSVSLRSSVHFADVETGWHWGRGPGLSVRLGVGWSWAFASSTALEAEFDEQSGVDEQDKRALEEAGARYLDSAITRYVMAPTLSLSIGFAFR